MPSETLRPLVTVYVTCHNYAAFLRQSLESVFDQSLESWELLVFDDGSSDEIQVDRRGVPCSGSVSSPFVRNRRAKGASGVRERGHP